MTNEIIKVHLDFETRSELNVKKTGAACYTQHPSTEILCLSYRVEDGPIIIRKREDIELWDFWGYDPDEIYEMALDPRYQWRAHNALFEQCVWKYIMVDRYGLPPIPVDRWVCTAAKAAYYALPRALDGASKALHLSVQKDMEGNRVMQKLSKPRSRLSKENKDKYWEPAKVPEDFERLYSYNIDDVETESELDIALPDLSSREQRIWETDQRMNLRGVRLDLPLIKRVLEIVETCDTELTADFQRVTSGQVERPSQRDKYLDWLTSRGVQLPDLQKATISRLLADHRDDPFLPDDVEQSLRIQQQLSQTSIKKYTAMMTRVSPDGRLRDILLYYGASRTGRWAGRGVQLQNLKRPTCDIEDVAEDVMAFDYDFLKLLYPVRETMAELVRGMIVADEGHSLFVADFSAIEARVNAWLANETTLLDLFRAGECNYCQLATSIYNRPIIKKEHPEERQIGKVGELALGYEGGINAFATMANGYGLDLAPAYPNIWASTTPEERELAEKAYNRYRHTQDEPVSREFGLAADVIKQRYRKERTAIKQFWRDVEAAAVEAVLTGRPVPCGKVTFFVHGPLVRDRDVILKSEKPADVYTVKGVKYVRTSNGACRLFDRYFLHIKLPSGRCLSYHRPRLLDTKTPWGKTAKKLIYDGTDNNKRYGRIDTYGGKLVENIVQAVARDLMAEAFVRIEDAGYLPLLQVHDEAISQAPVGFGSLEAYEKLMATPPAWAEGLPLVAEGWVGPRYKKG